MKNIHKLEAAQPQNLYHHSIIRISYYSEMLKDLVYPAYFIAEPEWI